MVINRGRKVEKLSTPKFFHCKISENELMLIYVI